MSYGLDPDQDHLSVSPDLGPKLFAKLLADDDESRHYSKESFKFCSRSENTQQTTFSVVICHIFLSPPNIWFWYISHFQVTKAGTNAQTRQTTIMYGCRWRLTKILLGFVCRQCRKNIHGWLLLSVDNLCNRFGFSSGPTKYHTVWQPDGKLILKEFLNTFNFEETNRQTTKKWKINQHAKS